ncbi:MAG: hypothetical protein N4A54_05560 [Peptostreptococcaceae bacterium]|nr:hypothetical protein [Peptostreptococcaceae bacterium]
MKTIDIISNKLFIEDIKLFLKRGLTNSFPKKRLSNIFNLLNKRSTLSLLRLSSENLLKNKLKHNIEITENVLTINLKVFLFLNFLEPIIKRNTNIPDKLRANKFISNNNTKESI